MLLPFIIAGLTTGSVYALAGVGLVLTYKTSGIFNFAHGSLATVSAFLFFTLHVTYGLSWPIAAAICVLIAGPVLGLLFERLSQAVGTSSLSTRVVATVGVLLVVQSVITMLYGTATRTLPQYLPRHRFAIGGTSASVSDVVIVIIGFAATAALYVYFRTSRTGVAMRAVVDESALLSLTGTNPGSVRRYAWMIGTTFAALSGVLLAPLIPLDATTMTLLVVQAFGAAAIGRFSSLPLTYAGGLAVGLLSSVATKYFTTGLLAGLPSALPFGTLFLLLVFSRRRRSQDEMRTRTGVQASWRAPWQVQGLLAILTLAVFVSVPAFAGLHLTDWTLSLCVLIVLLSLGLLVRSSGQVSLAHVSFMAIGACAFSHLSSHHVPWGVALIATGLIAVPVGALLSIPAIRLSGLYLALATLGFGIVLSYMFYSQSYMFGTSGNGLIEPRPSLTIVDLSSDRGFYYLVLFLTVLVCGLTAALNRSRLGRLLTALRDSPRGLMACGTSVAVTRVVVFCLSAFLAAVGGALQGVTQGVATGDSYGPLLSLAYFVVVIISIGGEPWYAVLSALGVTLIPSYLPGASTGNILTLIFGVSAVFYAMTSDDKRGLPIGVQRKVDRLLKRRPTEHATDITHLVGDASLTAAPVQDVTLSVTDLTVRFGGLTAVNGVSLNLPSGKIVGMIGPNGAGKTTTFDAVTGLNRPSAGRVSLNGRDISRRGTAARARSGVGRTFQRMELFDSLSVLTNVEIGIEGASAGWNVLGHIFRYPTLKRQLTTNAAAILQTCNISALADELVGNLSTGQRRLVELARCLAGPARLVLLDEPSSGLDRTETEAFAGILSRVCQERSLGILLVEHDMALVMAVCEYIYVLDFGKLIFQGTPAQVQASSTVRAAYLGDDGGDAALRAAEQSAETIAS